MTTSFSIAIADDYPRWRSFLNDYLTQEGFSIFCRATNGKDLLSQLEQTDDRPTICMMDINMPVMDGFETAKALRANYPTIKILAFSLEMGKSIVNRMLACGAHSFLAKGVAPQNIKEALLELMKMETQ